MGRIAIALAPVTIIWLTAVVTFSHTGRRTGQRTKPKLSPDNGESLTTSITGRIATTFLLGLLLAIYLVAVVIAVLLFYLRFFVSEDFYAYLIRVFPRELTPATLILGATAILVGGLSIATTLAEQREDSMQVDG